MRQRYIKVKNIVSNRNKGFSLSPLPFNSGYFMSFRYEKGDSEKLRNILLHEYGIGAISIQGKFLRIAFSSVDLEDLEELFEIVFDIADKCCS